MKPCVAICTPIYDRTHPAYEQSLRHLWKPSQREGAELEGECAHLLNIRGFLIEEARNALTEQALEAEPHATHLLWIDDDMAFPVHALKRLLEHDVPIVGGLCFNRRPPYHPIVIRRFADEEARDEEGEPRYGFCYHYPPDTLFEVDRIGAGFLLVKREVFEKMDKRDWWNKTGGLSEDFSFSHRAKALGYKLLVDTGLKIGHVGEVMVDESFARKNRPFEFASWHGVRPSPDGPPRATIVIPTYNQKPRYLRAAILSAAKQTVPTEVIVIDDGSDPPVPLEGWPGNVRVARMAENRGIANALNTGIEKMSTDWFCWLSSDDMLDPRKVEAQLSACLQSDMLASFHRYETQRKGENWPRYAIMPEWRNMREQQAALAQACCIFGSTVMVHKSVINDVGNFSPEFKYGQDWEWFCRVGKKYFWYALPDTLALRREDGNLTQAIAEDPVRKQIRDGEDAKIREMYGRPDYAI